MININQNALCDVSNAASFTTGTNQTLINEGQITGSVIVSGSLTGSGTMDSVSTLGAAVVAPGDNGKGSLTVSTFALNAGSTLAVTVKSGSANRLYDTIQTPASATLGGALSVTLATGFSAQAGDKFFILINAGGSPVTGTFSNVPGNDMYNDQRRGISRELCR